MTAASAVSAAGFLTKEMRKQIEEITERYPTRRSAIMPSLFLAQEKYGYLSDEVLLEVAGVLDVPEIWVYEVATFYTMFNTEPVGRFHIKLCTNVSCLLLEAGSLLSHLERQLGVMCGETTEDGFFTLSVVECLGSCDTAPMMQINETYYENLSAEEIDQILEGLKTQADDDARTVEPGDGGQEGAPA
ncbi:MAG: NADH-quinone oxidoreductase subunit NuoE [Alphaproteobacteria bacterium]|jgi:NADH-quinone oxidoreductase subunit E|nr:NADH-quinone oxidoreductase subunit NuoE [Alphaproteobacteria bacterium]MDP6660336.1 NADH-quinone oxidoreductase subunit NuoE [Alphaproteobacteria bacterium]MDP6781078.1 NADH-quinone oxidoreductase subunit NuoE [Alphaproteobacteria bacterium]|tara:strand:+ start:776 stop:1339 length:564 start_codon:yes stop_codon:yes gene_type:complete